MPALDAQTPGLPAVARFSSLLELLLDEAAQAKETTTIEPALKKADFNDLSNRILAAASGTAADSENGGSDGSAQEAVRTQQYAVIETAARDLFDKLIATTPIESPEFVKMWNLLDILSIMSDEDQCDPALLFWLVEELLDSQTISGCRIVFDYLESRRERITVKHFKQKQLVILRSCNELLRRLSRAEDTAFCGRVFIFLFQSFPLGDRSSVNLRGEYHVENVTSFEEPAEEREEEKELKMDVDTPAETPKEAGDAKSANKGVTFDSKNSEKPYDADALYPLFWSLQENFSQPLKLFDAGNFAKFKNNLDATMKAFQAIHHKEGSHSRSLENSRRNLKRKREEEGVEDASEAFNPKYLTSKDLFELEISDLSFRRHVLVQALIITDFLLSLSAGAKEKLANLNASNKSVIYHDQLSEENTKWATETKATISDYLKRGFDGPYFYRMVETVLARDKNWVFWKMASCPPIQRDPVSAETFVEAKSTAQRSATSKRLRPTPMGSVSLDFLKEEGNDSALDQLKSAERYQLPELDSFQRKIADDDFEIDMPTNDQTKAAAVAGKSSKSWRALRIASRSKLAAFDKIDDPKKVDVIFQELVEDDDGADEEDEAAGEDDMPQNKDPIIISGPRGVGKSKLISSLMDFHKGVFAPVVRHTTREPQEEEVSGKSFHFVKAQEFNQLRDGDRLIEYGTRDGTDYGTSSKVIDAIVESGKVPVIELDIEAAQFAKDMDFSARYVLIKPSSPEALKGRLSESGLDDAAVQSIVDSLPSELDESKVSELFDKVIVSGDDGVGQATESLAAYIFDKVDGAAKAQDGDEMDQDEKDEGEGAEDNEGDDADINEEQSEDGKGDEVENAQEEDADGTTIVVAASNGDGDTSMDDAVPAKDDDEGEAGE